MDHQYNIIDCASVCLVHDCQPEGNKQCGDSFLYKTVRVQPGSQKSCHNAVCKQKSGTCQGGRSEDSSPFLISH